MIPPSLVKSQACRLTMSAPRVRPIEEMDEEDGDDDLLDEGEERGEEREKNENGTEESGELVWATIGLSRVFFSILLYLRLLTNCSQDDLVV